MSNRPIGVFDSGFGGLTVLKSLKEVLPEYDYLYYGDNGHAPYGNKSFEHVYQLTLKAVKYLFDHGCPLVIVACNTASAKALRTIQQIDLPKIDSRKRVLGVLRPITESAGDFSNSGHIGVVGTKGTIQSDSYGIEISKFWPDLTVIQKSCPMWASLVENWEMESKGAEFFVKRDVSELLQIDPKIDSLILGCTHYPLLLHQIEKQVPSSVQIISQGPIVAQKLCSYLKRHSEMKGSLSKNGSLRYLTSDTTDYFDEIGSKIMGESVKSEQVFI